MTVTAQLCAAVQVTKLLLITPSCYHMQTDLICLDLYPESMSGTGVQECVQASEKWSSAICRITGCCVKCGSRDAHPLHISPPKGLF